MLQALQGIALRTIWNYILNVLRNAENKVFFTIYNLCNILSQVVKMAFGIYIFG